MKDKEFIKQLDQLSKEAQKAGKTRLQALLLILSGCIEGDKFGDLDFYWENTRHVHQLLADRAKGRIIDHDSKLN